jgi:hypothetical protein
MDQSGPLVFAFRALQERSRARELCASSRFEPTPPTTPRTPGHHTNHAPLRGLRADRLSLYGIISLPQGSIPLQIVAVSQERSAIGPSTGSDPQVGSGYGKETRATKTESTQRTNHIERDLGGENSDEKRIGLLADSMFWRLMMSFGDMYDSSSGLCPVDFGQMGPWLFFFFRSALWTALGQR